MFLSSWFRWSLSSETNPRVVSPGKSLLSCFMCHKEMRYEDSLGHRSNSAKVRIIQLEVCFNSTTTLEFVVAGCSRYGMVGPLEVTTPVHLSLLVTHANPELRKVLVFCCFSGKPGGPGSCAEGACQEGRAWTHPRLFLGSKKFECEFQHLPRIEQPSTSIATDMC